MSMLIHNEGVECGAGNAGKSSVLLDEDNVPMTAFSEKGVRKGEVTSIANHTQVSRGLTAPVVMEEKPRSRTGRRG